MEFVSDFPIKFGLACTAIQESGRLIGRQSQYATLVFPGATHESAQVLLTQCIKGTRKFRVEKLELFLSHFDPSGVLRNIECSEWQKPVEKFKAALVAAGLISASSPLLSPLSEKLGLLHTSHELTALLAGYRRTFDTLNKFESAFRRMPQTVIERVEALLHSLISAHWQEERHKRTVALASEVLARMATCGFSHYAFDALSEQNYHKLTPAFVNVVDPLCYLGVHHGKAGLFVKNLERMIEEPEWRTRGLKVDITYYDGLLRAAYRFDKHLRERQSHVRAHDIGRAIGVYPTLLNTHLDLADSLREETIRSLKEIGLRKSLRRQVEVLMRETA